MTTCVCRWPDGKTVAHTHDGPLRRKVRIPEMRTSPATFIDEDTPIESVYFAGSHIFSLTREEEETGWRIYDWESSVWDQVTVGPFGQIRNVERLEVLPWASTE